ncbi:MAG: DUF2269 domain-containing protein [Gammaproteobacteria bacterium]|nr:DUF2269 domain-containing protein [Gammaproteobacteria bacterium]MDD9863028.1 DUF2269 domain-containing protein [Gammaproteobacteria bacterium]
MEYAPFLLWLHVIGAAVLLGTGAGIAFFMAMAHRTRDAVLIRHTAGIVVAADYWFTAPAIVVQPLSGILLAAEHGWKLTEGWLALSLLLYAVAGACWLPVVWMQHRMRDLAGVAADGDNVLPAAYYRLFRRWTACGFPAFFSVLAIVWLMLAKPEIGAGLGG